MILFLDLETIGDRLTAGDGEWGYYLAASYDHSTSDRGTARLSNPLETVGGSLGRSLEDKIGEAIRGDESGN